MFNWWKKRKINAMLVDRAGLIAEIAACEKCKEIDPERHYVLGCIEEELRQLGWKEGD